MSRLCFFRKVEGSTKICKNVEPVNSCAVMPNQINLSPFDQIITKCCLSSPHLALTRVKPIEQYSALTL